jgi:type IV pilus assembly protein PilQ
MKSPYLMSGLALVLGLAISSPLANPGKTSKSAVQNKALYDFSFVGTDFRTAFQAIGARAGIDILPAPTLQGKLTLKVTQKTWQETLEIICNLNDFAYVIEDRYVHVLKREDYQKRKIEESSQQMQYDLIAPKVERIYHLKNSKAQALLPVVQGVLSQGARVTFVERNNALVVYDNELHQNKADSILRVLDVETRQVMISAKLLVVDSDYLRELGVNWGAKMGYGNAPLNNGTPGTGQMWESMTQGTVGNSPANVAADGTKMAFGLLQNKIGVVVSSLLSENKGELLASPQITTMDHTEAVITMGEQKSIRVIDAEGVSSNQLIDASIEMKAVPHITGDNRVMLELEPKNNSFNEGQDGISISTQTAKTTVVVEDGQTVVIAGLTRNYENNVETGVPFLKDIPVVGNLFKYKKKRITKKDLIIFVTPQILDRGQLQQVNTSQSPTTSTPMVIEAQAPVGAPTQAIGPAVDPTKK